MNKIILELHIIRYKILQLVIRSIMVYILQKEYNSYKTLRFLILLDRIKVV